MTNLAIFDLDNTLIAGDSDYAWGEFLVNKNIVDADYYAEQNQQFYDDYKNGCLDIYAFLRFSLQALASKPLATLLELREEFMHTVVESMILPSAEALLNEHRQQGHTLLIITATNTFVTQPIAERLGITHLIGTEPEIIDEQYTGEVSGTPSFQEGKITRLNQWLEQQNLSIGKTWFYSDSHNDIPLLLKVDKPVAVDPDDKLRTYAQTKSWDIISLRNNI